MANLADLTQDGGNVELQYLDNPPAPVVEPLDGYVTVDQVMDRFPEEVYNKSRDSHLYRFIAALAGDSGAGILKKQSYVARLKSEGGLLTFKDLDSQYTQVFRFPRLPSEQYPFDTDTDVDTLTQDDWNELHLRDERYYARAKKFFNATRLGNSPEGIKLAAEGGSGMLVDVYENYKAVYDLHSDDPLGIPFRGQTNSIHEFVVIPRIVNAVGDADSDESYVANLTQFPAVGGSVFATEWQAAHVYLTGDIVYPTVFNGHYFSVNAGGMSGGTEPTWNIYDPADTTPTSTSTDGSLTYTDIGVSVDDYFYSDTLVNSGTPVVTDVIRLDPAIEHNMVHVLDSIRPVGALMTITVSQKHFVPVVSASVRASSSDFNVRRYVTGRTDVKWPSVDKSKGYWIEREIENVQVQLPIVNRSHPVIWQTIDNVHAYTEEAVTDTVTSKYGTTDFYGGDMPTYPRYRSQHIGPTQGTFQLIFPFLQNAPTDDLFAPEKALSLQTTPLVIEKGHK